jgi:hypothetical protein
MFSGERPRSTRLTFMRLLIKRPADTRRAMERAICAVTREARNRAAERAPAGWPEFALRMVTRSARVLCRAGYIPKRIPVPMDRIPAKRMTGGLSPTVTVAWASGGRIELMKAKVQEATKRLAIPPRMANRHDSLRSWVRSWVLLAPREARMAISGPRWAPRAKRRFAMLAQAIRSTTPVMEIRKTRGVWASVCS